MYFAVASQTGSTPDQWIQANTTTGTIEQFLHRILLDGTMSLWETFTRVATLAVTYHRQPWQQPVEIYMGSFTRES